MRIHHLNCVSTCPAGGWLMDGDTRSALQRGRLVCHCLLIEAGSELVLVDTGFGTRDVADPKSRLSAFFLALLEPDFRAEMTAIQQIRRMGLDPEDVRHIVMTHLDFDHAGGLDDFPWATVHMTEVEREYAALQKTWLDRQRFRPSQWGTAAQWRTYPMDSGERWLSFDRVRQLDGLPPEIVMVPLVGHTFGHAGVAVQRDTDWLLQAGDAYFFHDETDPAFARCTPGLRLYQSMMDEDRSARIVNQEKLRELNGAGGVEIVCSHDVDEFERLSGRPAFLPETAFIGRPATAAL